MPSGSRLDLTREAVQDELRQALDDSIKHHLVADVPVGIFLSSGLDSSTITALASQGARGSCIPSPWDFRNYGAAAAMKPAYAAKIAARYGTMHQTHWITREDFHSDYHHILAVMDQPATDGVNMYFVAKVAAAAGMKTALSGLGGDELFGGYPSFHDIPRMVRTFSRPEFSRLGPDVPQSCGALAEAFHFPEICRVAGVWRQLRRGLSAAAGVIYALGTAGSHGPGYGPGRLGRTAAVGAPGRNYPQPAEDFLKVSALEMVWYMRNQLLRVADWAGMAHSLEIRVPLVDIVLLRKIAPLLASNHRPGKLDMAGTLADPLAR